MSRERQPLHQRSGDLCYLNRSADTGVTVTGDGPVYVFVQGDPGAERYDECSVLRMDPASYTMPLVSQAHLMPGGGILTKDMRLATPRAKAEPPSDEFGKRVALTRMKEFLIDRPLGPEVLDRLYTPTVATPEPQPQPQPPVRVFPFRVPLPAFIYCLRDTPDDGDAREWTVTTADPGYIYGTPDDAFRLGSDGKLVAIRRARLKGLPPGSVIEGPFFPAQDIQSLRLWKHAESDARYRYTREQPEDGWFEVEAVSTRDDRALRAEVTADGWVSLYLRKPLL